MILTYLNSLKESISCRLNLFNSDSADVVVRKLRGHEVNLSIRASDCR